MNVPCPFCRKEHFDTDDHEDRYHGDQTRHGWVAFVPEGRETWVCEGDEGGREEVHECGGYEDAGAEVAGEEEEAVRYWELREAADDNGN